MMWWRRDCGWQVCAGRRNSFRPLLMPAAASTRSRTASTGWRLRTPASIRSEHSGDRAAESPKTSLLLDLSEDRLDDRFAHLVHRPSCFGAQFMPHGFPRRGTRRRLAVVAISCLHVVSARGDMQIDARYAFIARIGLAPVARIGTGRVRLAAQVLFHLI